MQAQSNTLIKDLNFVHRKEVLYSNSVVTINLKNEEEFEIFKKTILDKHATWNVRLKKPSKNPALHVI
jgi:hypothetical protein